MTARIAVFEYVPNILKLLDLTLRARGYEVLAFAHELTTVAEIEPLYPDLLILGNIWGYDDPELQFAEHLKTQTAFRSLPIILLTTLILPENRVITLPGVYTMLKPFEPQALLTCVKDALNKAQT